MYQMMILLLFNNSSELTIEKIHDQTEIKIDLLLQILNSLLKSKILLCTQFIDQINLDMNCTIKLSNDFIR
jgi:cullin 1